MSTEIKRRQYAKLFFIIFFVKMTISSTPLFFQHVDKETIFQVVLQLEIENNNGKSGSNADTLKDFAKEYPKSLSHLTFLPPIDSERALEFVLDDDRDIRAFYPSVPTPPPNV